MTKMKLFIAVGLFLGMVGIGQASPASRGSYVTFSISSFPVAVGQGILQGVQCSTPGAAAQNLNTLFVQFFDTAPAAGTGVLAPGGIAMTSISSGNITTPQMVVISSNTTGTGGNMYVGADWSNFGGLHFDNGLYFYVSPFALGSGCTVIWRRDNE